MGRGNVDYGGADQVEDAIPGRAVLGNCGGLRRGSVCAFVIEGAGTRRAPVHDPAWRFSQPDLMVARDAGVPMAQLLDN